MIKINLLPVRAAKKKETAKQQLAIFVVSLVTVVALAAAAYSMELVKIKSAKDDIDKSEKEVQRLKTVIGEIDNIKKLQDEVKKKLEVLNHLRQEKTGPALRLAKLSDATPDKLWLTKYSENNGIVSISGVAVNEELIAEFLRNLQASNDFVNVELQVSEQTEISGIKAKKFDIACVLKNFKKDEPSAKAKK
ncbi:MAG TPA: PilN domain-containing protein [Geobacteraceae bacterium]